ncbi:MAG TPA: GNAT family N-acetyltransferase [Ideonella sp.]|nr:GNAT family N-acetyltransferase [Ideonella sp.]
MTTPIRWQWTRFEGLTLQGLYEVLALRQRVFVLEQGPYLDADGLDQHSWHLLGRDESGELLLYLRVVDPGLKFDEPSIGRVVVDKKLRGTGLGRVMVAEALERCAEAYPGQANHISAQAHLAKFYGEFGFEPAGEPYLEDDIPHLEMRRPA